MVHVGSGANVPAVVTPNNVSAAIASINQSISKAVQSIPFVCEYASLITTQDLPSMLTVPVIIINYKLAPTWHYHWYTHLASTQ